MYSIGRPARLRVRQGSAHIAVANITQGSIQRRRARELSLGVHCSDCDVPLHSGIDAQGMLANRHKWRGGCQLARVVKPGTSPPSAHTGGPAEHPCPLPPSLFPQPLSPLALRIVRYIPPYSSCQAPDPEECPSSHGRSTLLRRRLHK